MFRLMRSTEKNAVSALYDAARGTPFCVWNEYYPTVTEIEDDFAHGNLFVLTEDDGNTIIGAVSVMPCNEVDEFPFWICPKGEAAELTRVVIRNDMRGKGLAKRLVTSAESVLRERGTEWVHLLVEIHHIPAYTAYMKCGYRVMGECELYGHRYYACEKRL